MSRGRIVRWMLEEVGQPYRTELLDYRHDDEGARLSGDQPDGQGAGDHAMATTVVTEGAAICAYLADAFPQAGPRAAAGAIRRAAPIIAGCSSPPARWRPRDQQGAGLRRAARSASAMVGYGCYRRRAQRARAALIGRRLHSAGDQLHRRRRLCRLADRLGHAVRLDREAAGLRGLCRRASWRRPAAIRAREIDDALVAEKKARDEAAQ